MAFLIQLLLVLGLGGGATVYVSRMLREQSQQKQLDQAFYKILQSQDSTISLIELGASAQVDAEIAKEYLDRQVRVLDAVPEVDDDGDTFYRFPKLKLPQYLPKSDWDKEPVDDWD
jgi:hypothetical protein